MDVGHSRRRELEALDKSNTAGETANVLATDPEIELLVRAEHSDPFRVLGPHAVESGGKRTIVIRTLQPHAASVAVLWGKARKSYAAARIHPDGLYEAIIPAETKKETSTEIAPASYVLRITYPDGNAQEVHDAYAFPALLTDFDLYLFAEGTHYQNYDKLGAHVREVAGVRGVHFGVWAPNAKRVSVVGNFNNWDGRVNPMRSRGVTGVWEIFIPELGEGELYKFEIRSRFGDILTLKADPYGFAAEMRPKSSSVVATIDGKKMEIG
jgi:1,4-alpha-glucan branching enzyme